MKTFKNFSEAYVTLIDDVFVRPEFTASPRGLLINERLGYQFVIEDPLDRLPYVSQRNFSVAYWIAESLWYLSGSKLTSWIAPYSSMWEKISDDGTTANSAYGSRIFVPHDRICGDENSEWTQWNYVLDELSSDIDSRRAVIHIRSPKDSLHAKKDVPCTLSLQFIVRDDKLNLFVNMRSSDVVLGISYDVPAFTLFQELMAKQLSDRLKRKIDVGMYYHNSASLHLYERDFELAKKILADEANSSHSISAMTGTRMQELPGLNVPTLDLLAFEAELRRTNNGAVLFKVVGSIDDKFSENYWRDWARILASHRARKLGEKNYSVELLSSTSFDPYSFFDR